MKTLEIEKMEYVAGGFFSEKTSKAIACIPGTVFNAFACAVLTASAGPAGIFACAGVTAVIETAKHNGC